VSQLSVSSCSLTYVIISCSAAAYIAAFQYLLLEEARESSAQSGFNEFRFEESESLFVKNKVVDEHIRGALVLCDCTCTFVLSSGLHWTQKGLPGQISGTHGSNASLLTSRLGRNYLGQMQIL
jgi:hypothetical protein